MAAVFTWATDLPWSKAVHTSLPTWLIWADVGVNSGNNECTLAMTWLTWAALGWVLAGRAGVVATGAVTMGAGATVVVVTTWGLLAVATVVALLGAAVVGGAT